jgi:anti-sigma-K factor RskA
MNVTEKRVGRWVAAVAAVLVWVGCAHSRNLSKGKQTWALSASRDVPAASGTLVVEDESNGNRELELKVEHLAPPSKVFHDATQYVVWIIPEEGSPQNMGVLPLEGDLSAKFKTETAYRSFSVAITAETAADATEPSHHRVMSVNVRAPAA